MPELWQLNQFVVCDRVNSGFPLDFSTVDGDMEKTQRGQRGGPQRSADSWLRDLLDSLRVMSQPQDVQTATLQNLQIGAGEIIRRFQFEWEQFKKLHKSALPLNVAERLDWLAQTATALAAHPNLSSSVWKEIRQIAAEAVAMIEK